MHQLPIIIFAACVGIFAVVFIVYKFLQLRKPKASVIQKREYFRVDVPEPESFVASMELDNGSIIGCKLINIGIGGVAVLAVHAPVVLVVGSTIKEIMIAFPDGAEVRSPAVVRYVISESDSEWNKYGIQFTGLSDEQRDTIARYVLQTEAIGIKQQRSTEVKEGDVDS